MYLLEKVQRLGTKARAELIRTVLIEGNFCRAQQALPKTDEKKRSTSSTSAWGASVGSFFSASGSYSEDFLEREMKTLASKVPDAQFLLTIKGEGNKELRPMIDEAVALAHTQLAFSVDAVVDTMALAVSAMQKEHCERAVQYEVESEERKSRNKVLVKFIQDINAQAMGSQNSYAS